LSDVSLKKLILVPALISLGITLLRLAGEMLHWSPLLFNPMPGGGGALVGISWLVLIFGPYFALKLANAGQRPRGAAPAILYPLLGFALVPLAGVIGAVLGLPQQSLRTLAIFIVASIVGALVALRGWPALGRTLLAYALAARIPVVIVMLFAILGNWGTHYDVAPNPEFPAMAPLSKWLLIGVAPQLTIWIWFTIAVGGLVGGVVAVLTGRTRPPAAHPAAG
jgi:hypothetical protein